MNLFSNILQELSTAPEGQIDSKITTKLKMMSEKDDFDPLEMLSILDECAFAALASDFVMQAMHFVFEDMCKSKGLDSRKILRDRQSNASLV